MVHRQADYAVSHLVSLRQVLGSSTLKTAVGRELRNKRIEIAATEHVCSLHLCIEIVARHAVLLCVDEDREVAVIVAHARHIVEERDALNRTQRLTILNGYLMASLDGSVNEAKVEQTVCRTHLVHLAVDARTYDLCLAGKAEVLQIVDAFLRLLVVHYQGSALNGVVHLCGMEAKSRHIASIQDALAVHLHTERMSSVVYHLKTILVSDVLNSLCVARLAVDMHRHDSRSLRRDGSLYLGRTILPVAGSMSTNTGLQPFHQMLCVVATKLYGVVITSPVMRSA